MEVVAITSGGPSIPEKLASQTDLNFVSVKNLDDLENAWLEQGDCFNRLSRLEKRFGSKPLNEILIADRRIGNGYIYGGELPPTPLIKMSEDSELVRRILAGSVETVADTIDNFKPEAVVTLGIASCITHSFAAVCAHKNIPFLTLGATRIGDRYIVDNDSKCKLATLREEFKLTLKDPSRLDQHFEEAKQFIDEFRNRPMPPEYNSTYQTSFYLKQSAMGAGFQLARGVRALYRGLTRPNLRRDLRTPSRFGRGWWRGKVALRERYRLRYGPFLPRGGLPDTHYAYFPLHITPEASTMTWSPMFTDQIAAIEAISKSLPPSMNLVVKEHLPMVGQRPTEFYERLIRMPKVVLASPFENSFDLIAKAKLVAVITGTAGWEAILMGVPALVLGQVSYLDLDDGFVHCSDFEKLSDAIEEALDLKPVRDERLTHFVGTIFKLSFRLPSDILWSLPSKARIADLQSEIDTIAERTLALIPRINPEPPHSVEDEKLESSN